MVFSSHEEESMERRQASFQELFNEAYSGDLRTKAFSLQKSLQEASLPSGIGHPDYEYLNIGETEEGTIVVVFMDIRGFTKLAIALDNEEVVRILQATLAASIFSIRLFGGYVADLTGDGIMALFGGRDSTDPEDAFNAVSAAAFLMKGMKEVVAQRLSQRGEETVRVGMGLEYGEVLWTRLGLPQSSQVKPISGISFLAGKLCTGRYTSSWECKMGQNLAAWLPDQYKSRAARYEFQYNGRLYTHDLYLFDWEGFHRNYNLDPLTLEYVAKSRRMPRPTWPRVIAAPVPGDPTGRPSPGGPRPLKDQPFF